jgi:hypothetical protein
VEPCRVGAFLAVADLSNVPNVPDEGEVAFRQVTRFLRAAAGIDWRSGGRALAGVDRA